MHVHTCTRTCTWVYTRKSTWGQVYTYVYPYLTKETLASNLKGKRQSVRHAQIINNTLRTYSAHNTMHPLTTFQVRVQHERQRTWSPRETTYVIASRDNVRDRLERQRMWSPRETTYVTPRETTRQRDCEAAIARQRGCEAARLRGSEAASERAWSPWSQCHRVWAGVVKGSELFTNQRSLVKASYSN